MAGVATPRRNRNVSQYIAEAIGLEMERNEKILVLGEDVGVMGGVFGCTRGLQGASAPTGFATRRSPRCRSPAWGWAWPWPATGRSSR